MLYQGPKRPAAVVAEAAAAAGPGYALAETAVWRDGSWEGYEGRWQRLVTHLCRHSAQTRSAAGLPYLMCLIAPHCAPSRLSLLIAASWLSAARVPCSAAVPQNFKARSTGLSKTPSFFFSILP